MYRHEYKHIINFSDYLQLKSKLKMIMRIDSNSGNDGFYKITSLYFDNYDDKALREKLNGYLNREKFRIRFYNDNYDFIRLEKKSKVNGLTHKESANLSRDECQQIIDGSYDFLKEREEDLLKEFYAKIIFQSLRPRSVIVYKREAFIYPPGNVRVTLDYDIKYSNNTQIFENNQNLIKASKDIVLEVKFDNFLPQLISNVIQLGNRTSTAFSKYVAGRI